MDYQNYSVEDFVLDEKFRKWVLNPDKELNDFWIEWLDLYPYKAADVKQAIVLLRQISVRYDGLSEQQRSSMSFAIEEGIDAWEKSKMQESPERIKTVPLNAYAVTHQKLRASKVNKKWSGTWVLKIAASIVFIFGMFYGFYHNTQEAAQVSEIEYTEVVKENPYGQKLTVFLADGSKVILNAGSKISFTEPFHPDHRTVNLVGEAFFEVAQDSLRPFQVESAELTTIAIGTSFNIAAYPNDSFIEVSLSSGKVKVNYHERIGSDTAGVYFLLPGEQLGYNKRKQLLTKRTFDMDKVLAWKEGVIYLENEDQATVVKTLERWYGTQIKVEGQSASEWSVTAKFDNQSLKSVLTSLSYTMGFEFEIKENHVLIKYPTNT
ncbi:transmembrane sensor [Catalinimonas alkaloidigena]|uniref:FecR family protein n=1 Tax=Catalinimonas alkaloidigena TaxID=1075417 RepID=UPI002406EA7D|nr:FecR domain-containing protein [Catalinimonas alkaloidigena]MDF9796368.1 transmembrane sensor [Catalinimonas alkaloidigena]